MERVDLLNALRIVKDHCKDCSECDRCPIKDECDYYLDSGRYPYEWDLDNE